MVMPASVFTLLEKTDSEKDWSILMKDLIGTMNYELGTLEKLHSSQTKLHLKNPLDFPYVYVIFSKWQRLRIRPKFISVFCSPSFS